LNEIYILDACALIALLSEVYYHIYKLYDRVSALNFLNEIKESPIQLHVEVTNDIIINAGQLKTQYKLSLADAIGLAETLISKGSFVTADHHELDMIEKNENINFTWIR
jgi:predicted nucleic acid-binding protein